MKNKVNSRRAFSLVELLVALSILAVVAAIIVPRFLNVREEAVQVTADAQIKELNNIYKKWTVLGGRMNVGGTASALDIVTFLCADGSTGSSTRGLTGNNCRDSTSSFGSYTIGLSTDVVTGSSNAAVTVDASTDDGFIKNAALSNLTSTDGTSTSGTIGAGLIYKQGNYVFEVTFSGVNDSGVFALGTPWVL